MWSKLMLKSKLIKFLIMTKPLHVRDAGIANVKARMSKEMSSNSIMHRNNSSHNKSLNNSCKITLLVNQVELFKK